MTARGMSKVFTAGATNATIDTATEFKTIGSVGNKAPQHSGLWLMNLSTTAAEIIWFTTKQSAASAGGDDCFPLRTGERVLIPWHDRIDAISASGTPTNNLFIGGDFNASLIYA